MSVGLVVIGCQVAFYGTLFWMIYTGRFDALLERVFTWRKRG